MRFFFKFVIHQKEQLTLILIISIGVGCLLEQLDKICRLNYDESYSRIAQCPLNLISTFLLSQITLLLCYLQVKLLVSLTLIAVQIPSYSHLINYNFFAQIMTMYYCKFCIVNQSFQCYSSVPVRHYLQAVIFL